MCKTHVPIMIIDMMGSIWTDEIDAEINDSTPDPTGQENLSIVVRYVNGNDSMLTTISHGHSQNVPIFYLQ